MKNSAQIIFLFWIIMIQGCRQTTPDSSGPDSPVDFVNPYMGNISHLLVPTYPTVHLPHSMLRVIPERTDFTGDRLAGLPVVTTGHRGISAFNLSPYQGTEENLRNVIPFSYDHEKITPYYYSVFLDEQETTVRFAPSHQSGIYEFGFQKEDPVYLILNSRMGELHWNGKAISGHQLLKNDAKVYIYLEPDKVPVSGGTLQNSEFLENQVNASGRNACLMLLFPAKTEILKVRYGISFINEEQARKNLEREIRSFDLKSLISEGRRLWNEALGKIEVEGGSTNDRIIFYTSLYRTFERPVCISEDGLYFSAYDGKVHEDGGIPFYTDDWIWDTYRAAHPLRILIEPEKEEQIIRSFLTMTEQMENPWMPTFPGITGDSRSMNSNHGVATILDGWVKGIRGFDLEKAYEASKKAITEKTLAPWSGKPAGELDRFYWMHGYFPALREGEQESVPEVHSFEKRQPVAVTLGTSYDTWCLAGIAEILGKTEDYNYFNDRSYNYRNLFNPATRFFHPKDNKGEFIQPFDYVFSGGQGVRQYYDENNGWIYRWDVQHHIADLINLMGGRDSFVQNLDDMFVQRLGKSKFEFFAQLPDHTGNVGQFSMANEPSLHIPYLYNYAGQPWKTQKRIRSLINQWFRNDLMGIPGDEDGGGMSAFVVFSQMGFYPVTPGLPAYVTGSPFFSKVTVHLPEGKTFVIMARNNSTENKYIQSAKLNGKTWEKAWFSHEEMIKGGVLEVVMGNNANKSWGTNENTLPPSGER